MKWKSYGFQKLPFLRILVRRCRDPAKVYHIPQDSQQPQVISHNPSTSFLALSSLVALRVALVLAFSEPSGPLLRACLNCCTLSSKAVRKDG